MLRSEYLLSPQVLLTELRLHLCPVNLLLSPLLSLGLCPLLDECIGLGSLPDTPILCSDRFGKLLASGLKGGHIRKTSDFGVGGGWESDVGIQMAVSAHQVQPTQHGIFCVLAPDQICNVQSDVLVLVVYSVSPTLEVSSTVHLQRAKFQGY